MDSEFIQDRISDIEKVIRNFEWAKEQLSSSDVKSKNTPEYIAICNLAIDLCHEMINAAKARNLNKLKQLDLECKSLMAEVLNIFSNNLAKNEK